VDLERAREILVGPTPEAEGSFYGNAEGLSLGRGLVISGVPFPTIREDRQGFSIRAGLVYVFSHECDLEPSNVRFLNGNALIGAVLQLRDVLAEAETRGMSDDALAGNLGHLASRRMARAVYFPPIPDHLTDGGILSLNMITFTGIEMLVAGTRVTAITDYADRVIEEALREHLTREKSELLPLSASTFRRGRSIMG
jgi:hypothetical protein